MHSSHNVYYVKYRIYPLSCLTVAVVASHSRRHPTINSEPVELSLFSLFNGLEDVALVHNAVALAAAIREIEALRINLTLTLSGLAKPGHHCCCRVARFATGPTNDPVRIGDRN